LRRGCSLFGRRRKRASSCAPPRRHVSKTNNSSFFSPPFSRVLLPLLVQAVRTVLGAASGWKQRLFDSRGQRRYFPDVRVRVLFLDGVERAGRLETRVAIRAQSRLLVRIHRPMDAHLRREHSIHARDASVVRRDHRELSVRV